MIHKFKKNNMNIVLDVNSGSIHLIDDLTYDLLEFYPKFNENNLEDRYEKEEIKQAIEEVKYLIDENQLFTEDVNIDNFEIYNKPVIKSMCLHVAHDCNLRCKYCFASQGNYQKAKKEIMSLEVGKQALKYLAENSGNRHNLEVDFFGGEPLMNFEVVKELVYYGRKIEKEYNKNFRFTMTTNGTLLNDEINDFLNEHMENVVLSIDGRKEVNDRMRYFPNNSGSHDIIVPKFKSLIDKREGLYYIRGTFTGYNTDFSKDILYLADLGFESLSVEPVVTSPEFDYALKDEDLETIKHEYDILAEEYLKRKLSNADNKFDFFHFNIELDSSPCYLKKVRGCGAGLEYIAVIPSGDIYPCHQFVDDEEFKMGDIYKGIEKKEIQSEFMKSNVLTKEACQECWAKFFCSGGCHANAYNFNKDMKIPYALGCEMERKRIENSIYIQASLAVAGSND